MLYKNCPPLVNSPMTEGMSIPHTLWVEGLIKINKAGQL